MRKNCKMCSIIQISQNSFEIIIKKKRLYKYPKPITLTQVFLSSLCKISGYKIWRIKRQSFNTTKQTGSWERFRNYSMGKISSLFQKNIIHPNRSNSINNPINSRITPSTKTHTNNVPYLNWWDELSSECLNKINLYQK